MFLRQRAVNIKKFTINPMASNGKLREHHLSIVLFLLQSRTSKYGSVRVPDITMHLSEISVSFLAFVSRMLFFRAVASGIKPRHLSQSLFFLCFCFFLVT